MASETIDIEDIEDNGDFFDTTPIDEYNEENDKHVKKDDIIDNKQVFDEMKTKKKQTMPVLTKYERAKLIGLRAQQISKGMEPMIDPYKYGLIDTIDIARKELEEKKIPLIIRRKLPDGSYEDWQIDEFDY
jgi:DNA-directed RNA polymerase I, II, and III subunit RPABC2